MRIKDDFECPYCGHIQSIDDFIDYLQDNGIDNSGYEDITCDKCGKTFEVFVEIDYEVDYTITEITKHNF